MFFPRKGDIAKQPNPRMPVDLYTPCECDDVIFMNCICFKRGQNCSCRNWKAVGPAGYVGPSTSEREARRLQVSHTKLLFVETEVIERVILLLSASYNV